MQSTEQTPSILIVEDDESVREIIEFHLGGAGFVVEWAGDGVTGLAMALSGSYALVVLDINLPGMNGLDVCKQIRREKEFLPILMLTAQDAEVDRVVGLEIGADDYLTKPFSVRELLARIRARLRTQSQFSSQQFDKLEAERANTMVSGNLVIDPVKRTVTLSGRPVALTAKEFDVLLFLAEHPGRPFTREQLLLTLWGVSVMGYEDNVSQLITRLRKKLGEDGEHSLYIKTVRGVGYRFVDQHELSGQLSGQGEDDSAPDSTTE